MKYIDAQTLYTPEDYLIAERKATIKSEYLSGEILTMPRVNLAHNFIRLDIATEINIQLKEQEYAVVISNMRVKATPDTSYFYPDLVVFCGEPEFEDDTLDTLLNPVVIIEVLSPSTETYDREEKFGYYKQLPSLKEYILVAQDKVHVEHYQLQEMQWELKEFHGLQDTLTLSSIDCKLSLDDVYMRVDFD